MWNTINHVAPPLPTLRLSRHSFSGWFGLEDAVMWIQPDAHRVLTALQEHDATWVKWRLCIILFFCAFTRVNTYLIKLHVSVYFIPSFFLIVLYFLLLVVFSCAPCFKKMHCSTLICPSLPPTLCLCTASYVSGFWRLPVWQVVDGLVAIWLQGGFQARDQSKYCLATHAIDVFSLSPIF